MKAGVIILLLLVTVFTGYALNILPNPSFELWLDTIGVHLPVGWLSSELLYPASAIKDTNSNTGSYCVRLVGSDTSAFITTVTLVRPGFHYEFSGYARVPGVLGGSFVLQFLNWQGGPTGTPSLIPLYYSNDYRRYSNWVTAPDSAMFISVSCVTLPSVQLYVDDVTVDDTTLSAINELSEIKPRRTRCNKVLFLSRENALSVRGQIFDVLGRRIHPRAFNPGVYFIIEGSE